MTTPLFESILEITPDALLLETLSGNILDSNRAACELFGYDKESLLRKNLADLIPQAATLTVPLLIQNVITREAFGKHKDGSIFPAQVRSTLLENDKEQVALIQVEDISERRQIDAWIDRHMRLLRAYYHISHTLASSQKLHESLQAIIESIVDALCANQATLILYDSSQKRCTGFFTAGPGVHNSQPPSFEELLAKIDTIDIHNIKTKLLTPVESPQIGKSFDINHQNVENLRTTIVIPVTYKNQVLGIINITKRFDQPGFTLGDEKAVLAIAHQIGLRLENSFLSVTENLHGAQLDALRATIADISTEMELSKFLPAILDRAINLLSATGGDLGLYLPERDEIKIVASKNMGKDYNGVRMTLGEGAMGLAAKNQAPVIVNDYKNWENASKQYLDGPWNSVLAVPFMIGSRLVGAIGIVDINPTRLFSASEQHLLNLFAQQAAIAVENAHLYKSAHEAVERRAVLHKVSQQIVAASLSSEEIYAAIHNAASELMTAEAFAITWLNEEKQEIEAVYLIDRSGRIPKRIIPIGQGLTGRVINTGQTIYIDDTLDRDKLGKVFHFGDPQEVRSILAVPMRLRGKVVGVISAQSYEPAAYSSEDQCLLEMLASYAAIALDNAILFNHTQRLAITDSVTELYNRRHLFELGHREFHRATRFDRSLSVIMIDIDHFKQVNDTYGHATGDRILRNLAQFLRGHLRDIDIIGRYGGEEFTIILPETPLSEAHFVADRLREEVLHSFKSNGNGLSNLTISLGVAEINQESSSFDRLVAQADAALYAAKQAGRNRVFTNSYQTISIASPNE